MDSAFDVVIVPDFQGKNPAGFEMRTLFFLASWIENAGKARDFPLHLACIGEPPQSVRWLAAQCNASVTVHPPMDINRYSNTLRGLEIQHQTDRVLLLDTDFFVISDFSELSGIGYCISARTNMEARVPEGHWLKIYQALEMTPPAERIPCMREELGIPLAEETYPGEAAQAKAMFPYYNSGALIVPSGCGLRRIWEEHLRIIAGLFDKSDVAWGGVGASDQTGLATAIEVLKRSGLPFKRLPDEYHAVIWHIYKSYLPTNKIKLYHAFGFCKWVPEDGGFSDQDAFNSYYRKWERSRLLKEWYREYGFIKGIRNINRSLISPIREASCMMRWLYSRCKPFVQEALQQNKG